MKLIYAMEPISGPSIFLAGPTPRSLDLKNMTAANQEIIRRLQIKSWRPQAIEALRELGFNGAVLIPEDRDGGFHGDYLGQIDWETEALQQATCILFWVPRKLDIMPGLTTNDEWGFWKASGKVVFGAPTWAEKVRYQQLYCKKLGIPCSTDLRETCELAVVLFEQLYEPEVALSVKAPISFPIDKLRKVPYPGKPGLLGEGTGMTNRACAAIRPKDLQHDYVVMETGPDETIPLTDFADRGWYPAYWEDDESGGRITLLRRLKSWKPTGVENQNGKPNT